MHLTVPNYIFTAKTQRVWLLRFVAYTVYSIQYTVYSIQYTAYSRPPVGFARLENTTLVAWLLRRPPTLHPPQPLRLPLVSPFCVPHPRAHPFT